MAQQKIEPCEHILPISDIVDETPSVKAFRMGLSDNEKIEFYPGQFFMVSFLDESIKASRAYSIASSPLNKQYIEIALNKIGDFTSKLFLLKNGDLLKFKGPYGKFYFSEEMKNNLVLIAGGTGITPLMSIARYCNDKKLSNKVKLFYSARTPDEIIYKKEIEMIKSSNKNFDFFVAVTRAENSKEWGGRKGRIDVVFLKEKIGNVCESLYFLCGPKEFVHSIVGMLFELGVDKEMIKTDVWG